MANEKINKTYYCILCEMSGFDYEATNSFKALARECKKLLLDNINAQVDKGKINDPIFGCSIKSFHGHPLAWNKAKWRKSAKIVYQYFKASTLIKEIKSYEDIFGRKIVYDYNALLEYLYACFSNNEEIEWSRAPSLGKDFCLVPESVLIDKIDKFKELYE